MYLLTWTRRPFLISDVLCVSENVLSIRSYLWYRYKIYCYEMAFNIFILLDLCGIQVKNTNLFMIITFRFGFTVTIMSIVQHLLSALLLLINKYLNSNNRSSWHPIYFYLNVLFAFLCGGGGWDLTSQIG